MDTNNKSCEWCGEVMTVPYRVTQRYWQRRRFCSSGCRIASSRGRPSPLRGKELLPLEERFWSKVGTRGDGCWIWVGAHDGGGYGYLAGTRGGGSMKAHRVSYELHHGGVPDGVCVCHRCDNPACVNPAHLFLGTRADNNADKVAKGRQPSHRGEANPNAKLSREDVARIRRLRADGMTQQAIADEFGVTQVAVSSIVRGLSWPDVVIEL